MKPFVAFPEQPIKLKVVRLQLDAHADRPASVNCERLVIVIRGAAAFKRLRSTLLVCAGDVMIISRGVRHEFSATDGLSLVSIYYDATAVSLARCECGKRGAAPKRRDERFPFRHLTDGAMRLTPEELSDALKLVGGIEGELKERTPGYPFFVFANFLRLLGILSRIQSTLPITNSTELPSKVEMLLDYIENHYADPLTAGGLAALLGVSETSLYRIFKGALGRSPMEYLIRRRIEKATCLLQQGYLRVSEVSEAVGFNDSNYFTRQYRRITDCTPGQIRRVVTG